MKMKALTVGIISVISPIPGFILTILWCWTWVLGIWIGLLGYDTIPQWLLIFSLLPLFVSQLLGLFGVVYGIIRRKEKHAWLGILLSALCLVVNGLMLYGMVYIGSRY